MAISSCPDTLFTAAFFQVAVENNELSPQTPFLQTKQLLLLLLILVLQSFHHTVYDRAAPHSPFSERPKTEHKFKVWSHKCHIQGHNPLPSPAGQGISARIPLAFLSTWAQRWLTFSWLCTSILRSKFSTNQYASMQNRLSTSDAMNFAYTGMLTVMKSYSAKIKYHIIL